MRISDWSSDVCSSDLVGIQGSGVFPDLDVFDLQRIEVLKGPQGTLYGEGSMGGSLKMVTNAPDMQRWILRTQASIANTEDGAPSNDARVAVNVPKIGRASGRERVCQSV